MGPCSACPHSCPPADVLATKLVSLFPLNTERPTHQAVICCFDPADGRPLALMDGTYITAMRTAAGSALATRLLARRDARTACVIGTGVQAHAHVTLLARHPGLERIRVAGRDATRVARLVDEFAEVGLQVEAAPSIEEGVRSADIVCAATHSDRPVGANMLRDLNLHQLLREHAHTVAQRVDATVQFGLA